MSDRVLLRGGCVITCGAKAPNLPVGDVLIEGDRIADVGRSVAAPRETEVVDATDAIVMPGFVDTHRHTWTSLFRNLGEAGGVADASVPALSACYEPDDVYAATLIGLLGAIEAGVSTVVDWSDVATDDASAEAAVQAHVDAGARTVLVRQGTFGATQPGRVGAPTLAFGAVADRVDDVERVAGACRKARAAGLRVHVHASAGAGGPGVATALARHGLLGSDVTLVHQTKLDDDDLRAIAGAGAAVSLAPSSEMATGYGSPPIQELIDHGIRPGLGVNHEGVTPGDLFAQMRQTISLQHATVFDRKLMGKGSLPKLMSTRDVIRFATVEGARVAGLAGVTGSLERGLRADVLVLRCDRPNVWPINDPIGALVWGMDTSNIDRVIVGGRTLLRDGAVVGDVERARRLAVAARDRVAATAGLQPVGVPQ